MIQSKKAIGFFGSLAFLAFGYFYFSAKGVLPFADFALLEWQTKLVEQGIFYLPYTHQTQDPDFSFFPLPDLFFQLTNGTAQSTFPNFYPLLISPIFRVGELSGVVISQINFIFRCNLHISSNQKRCQIHITIVIWINPTNLCFLNP